MICTLYSDLRVWMTVYRLKVHKVCQLLNTEMLLFSFIFILCRAYKILSSAVSWRVFVYKTIIYVDKSYYMYNEYNVIILSRFVFRCIHTAAAFWRFGLTVTTLWDSLAGGYYKMDVYYTQGNTLMRVLLSYVMRVRYTVLRSNKNNIYVS